MAPGLLDFHPGAEGQERHRRILIRVGVSEGAADGCHVPDADGPHPAKCLGQDGQARAKERGYLRVTLSHEGPEADGAVRRFGPVASGHVVQAHQAGRAQQALAQHGHQSGAAGDDPSLVSVLLEDGERLVEGARGAIVEGVHGRLGDGGLERAPQAPRARRGPGDPDRSSIPLGGGLDRCRR
jgi:hypothetical protein